jgi:hypothetical protein
MTIRTSDFIDVPSLPDTSSCGFALSDMGRTLYAIRVVRIPRHNCMDQLDTGLRTLATMLRAREDDFDSTE